MRKKFYVGALAMAMATLVAVGAGNVKADAAAVDADVVYAYDKNTGIETLTVTDGSAVTADVDAGTSTEPYMFYTTTNVTATTIPANSKWMKIPGSSHDTLDVTSYTGKTTFFFAQSPNPSSADDILKVVLPAKPTITGITYKAGATVTDENKDKSYAAMFDLAKFKVNKAAVTLADDTAVKEVMPALEQAVDALSSQQTAKTYSVVYYNNDGTVKYGETPTTTDKDKVCYRYEMGVGDSAKEENGKYLRPSVPFTLKIAKPAAAPSITFNYANHTMALKKDMQYVFDANFDDVEMGTGARWSDGVQKVEANEDVVLTSGKKYAVITAAKNIKSIPTYISVPVTEPFSGVGGKVSVEGTLIESTKDKIILHLGAAGAGVMTYQYKIVAADDVDNYIDADNGCFDYSAADAGKGWTNVAVTNSKDVTIANSKNQLAGKSILVRVMKGKASFSSDVVILNQPDEAGRGWLMATPDAPTAGTPNATRGKAEYDPANKTITIPFEGIKEQVTLGEGQTRDAVSISVAGSKTPITVADEKAKLNDEKTAFVIDMTGNDDFAKLDGSKAVTVTIPTNWLVDGLDNVLPEQKVSVYVDNVEPKITAATMTKDKAGNAILTVTIDSPVQVAQDGEKVEAGAEVGIDCSVDDGTGNYVDIITVTPMVVSGDSLAAATGKDDLARIDSATLKLSGGKSIITITLENMPTIADMIAGYKVTLNSDSITDLVGNKFVTDKNSVTAENKVAYNKDAKAAVLKAEVSEISSNKVTVTVTSDKTLNVKSLTALKNAITAETGFKVSGVTWKVQNKSFTFTISGLTSDTTGTLATINKAEGAELITDAEGFELAPVEIAIKASSGTGGSTGDGGEGSTEENA